VYPYAALSIRDHIRSGDLISMKKRHSRSMKMIETKNYRDDPSKTLGSGGWQVQNFEISLIWALIRK